MKKLITLSTFIFISFSLFAQDILHCGTDEMRIATLKKSPAITKAVIDRENKLEEFTKNFISEKELRGGSTDTALYTIPVVFHIIHNYGNENISNEQVYDAIDVLNKTFRKQRADTADIVADFKPIHSDTRIEFRLVKKDPQGNCHSGINRIASYLSEAGQHDVKSLVQWDPSKYLNVYVVKNAAGLAGHAIFPSDADTIPAWDGIVISHNYVGSIGTSNPTRSVVLAHECGHYLNLQHIWGGNNVPGYYFLPCADPNHDCNIDDGVADTPPTIGWQSCNLSGSSCGNTVDNVQNVMDYSYCNIMFTEGQKNRMQAALNSTIGNRNNLWQPANLIAAGIYDEPFLCAADFSSNKKVVCPGGSITFNNESYQPEFDSLLWTFQGGTPASSTAENPDVIYNLPGVYDVSLKVFLDNDSIFKTKVESIVVLSETNPATFPYSESFENMNSINENGWLQNSFDELNDWELSTQGFYSGSHAAMINNFNNMTDTKDELYSPLIDLSQTTETNISFKYAFARKTENANDELQLQINKNCSSFWFNRLTISDTILQTVSPQNTPFIPTNQNQWKQASTSIPSSYLVDDFRFRFVFNGRGGNNLFIDDINIDVTAGIDENYSKKGLKTFPNPTSGIVYIHLPKSEGNISEIKLTDTKGALIKSFSPYQSVDLSFILPGIYFLSAETEKDVFRQIIIKY